MATLMLGRSACMIVRDFIYLPNSTVLQAPLLSPARPNWAITTQEEKNEKSEVLVRFYPMY